MVLRKATCAFFLILLCNCAVAQPKTFELLSGQIGNLRSHTEGALLEVRPLGTVDTLSLWAQGVTKTSGPDWEEAEEADLVVWCFPARYQSQKHILPDRRRIAIVKKKRDGRHWVTVLSLRLAKRIDLVE